MDSLGMDIIMSPSPPQKKNIYLTYKKNLSL